MSAFVARNGAQPRNADTAGIIQFQPCPHLLRAMSRNRAMRTQPELCNSSRARICCAPWRATAKCGHSRNSYIPALFAGVARKQAQPQNADTAGIIQFQPCPHLLRAMSEDAPPTHHQLACHAHALVPPHARCRSWLVIF